MPKTISSGIWDTLLERSYQSWKVLKETSDIGISCSSAKLFLMQNCADDTLLVRDIFNFLWDQGAHMFVWKGKQNFCIIPTCITCSKSTIKILEQGLKVSKLTRKTTEWCHWRHSRALFVIFKYILHLLLLFWLLTLSM